VAAAVDLGMNVLLRAAQRRGPQRLQCNTIITRRLTSQQRSCCVLSPVNGIAVLHQRTRRYPGRHAAKSPAPGRSTDRRHFRRLTSLGQTVAAAATRNRSRLSSVSAATRHAAPRHVKTQPVFVLLHVALSSLQLRRRSRATY
jgi:hypothetical protein